MSPSVLIFDTSLLCCWLDVPGLAPVGTKSDPWTTQRIAELIDSAIANGSTVVLPLATIIETGNHISQAKTERFKYATNFADYLRKCASETEHQWAAFVQESEPWTTNGLLKLADEWPENAKSKFSIGDWAIRHVADYYSEAGCEVSILTADQMLKSYEPKKPVRVPRKRL